MPDSVTRDPGVVPFEDFAGPAPVRTPLRRAITAMYRRAEVECVPPLVEAARLSVVQRGRAEAEATALVEALRRKGARGPVEGLVREYDLSSQEGVALMCLAEALLRVPDRATRDALIRDKIGRGDWAGHLGHSPSLFVNAATWGLVVTGKLTGMADEAGLGAALTRLIARGGEPLIRAGVDRAMRMMGQQFVAGRTIAEALAHARRLEARGFRYSYDMLGEAAATAEDAGRYYRDYEAAIHAIGAASGGRGLIEGPGISIKLSALHPRYCRAQRGRVMAELLPRLVGLAVLARRYDVGLNIDAEEADRLELSLDLVEALCFEPGLAGWDGIGFVVQAYQKRAPAVLDWLIDLGRRSGHRLMVRLVKGAYWDSEIKRAQVDGLAGFPVFTRKVHTDVSYLACAAKMLGAGDAVFAQFATHNAYTVAAVESMAGEVFEAGRYEFQCLHGMGEPLYEELVGRRPVRIYAPVGSHETLLAYLVRRLLENGANSSFVNRIGDPAVSVAELVADPVAAVAGEEPVGAAHPRISLPRDLFAPVRANAAGLDLSDEDRLCGLESDLREGLGRAWRTGRAKVGREGGRAVLNPSDRRDVVGHVVEAEAGEVERALERGVAAAPGWGAVPAAERGRRLLRAADLLEAGMGGLLGLIMREAGKSAANAVAEVREAVDFLRYYAVEAAGFDARHRALGVVACISPWNFPLAIFTGQVAAALAAGNVVMAKPAEETPLIAAQAVAILHEAGVPEDVLGLLPGGGEVGARLVGDGRVGGVVFTGSGAVARSIQRTLAARLGPDGRPVPLIAETGGQNAMVVDSSALAEQVVADVLVSAFDSAGQRCSALRVLLVQEEVADRVLLMLLGAIAELSVGNPDRLSVDVGPVISEEAREGIEAHVEAMRGAGYAVHRVALPPACAHGTFVAPTVIELPGLVPLTREVFGPVLHVVRYRRDELDQMLDALNGTGYGLTFGVHTRLDAAVARVTGRVRAGNVYVNRNLVGAVVGVQPFGGRGLSGTGPKAGGPLYLRRLLVACPVETGLVCREVPAAGREWAAWLAVIGEREVAGLVQAALATTPVGVVLELPGPVGEHNVYRTEGRGLVLCLAGERGRLLRQIGSALATGNRVRVGRDALEGLPVLPDSLRPWIEEAAGDEWVGVDAVLFDGESDALLALGQQFAAQKGVIVPIYVTLADEVERLVGLIHEQAISTNTAASGGNAKLMMLG